MGQRISIDENGIYLIIEIDDSKDVRLIHFSCLPFDERTISDKEREHVFRIVEIQMTGEDQDDHHGSKYVGTMPGNILKYEFHKDYRNNGGRKLEIAMQGSGLFVTAHFQFFDKISVIRSWTEVKNIGSVSKGLEFVSSFAITGIAKEGIKEWDEKTRLYIPHNTWKGEVQWRNNSLPELGLSRVSSFSLKRISYTSTGTWSTSEFLPMGCFENIESGAQLFWQIEHNGSWYWEISDIEEQLYLRLSGPTESENHWWKSLSPGSTFISVPVAVGTVKGEFEKAMYELTRYRRKIRCTGKNNDNLPVIFNDYMHCLWADPTTESLLPLIDKAAELGCEYYCIDAGWYSEGEWWDSVGEWIPSKTRFPKGIEEPIKYIKSRGMVPGLWIEIEVMGVKCSLAHKFSDRCFFQRHGKRVIDHGRYQLDFRNTEVTKHANKVVDRLVNDYGVGYIKIDYNINAGIGTEIDADSFGDGLFEHNKAFTAWLDSVLKRYPELVIETCASGGMRMDYALLSRSGIQSITDQDDYRKTAIIAASCPTAVLPEQCGIWSYPRENADREEVVYNMVNALLLRIHQSGDILLLSEENINLIKDGLRYYKSIRRDIYKGIPFWPLGLPSFSDGWVSLGLCCGSRSYLSVWRLESSAGKCRLPIGFMKNHDLAIKCAYPSYGGCEWEWDSETGTLCVTLPQKFCARFFELQKK